MTEKWTVGDIPDLNGKTILITGANSGLGLECSTVLGGKGARVVMAVRNLQKGEKAREKILARHPQANLDLMQLDLANLQSVRDFADSFKTKYDRLDIQLNNAGVMAIPRQETADGFEMQLGVNHLGHFALTGLLLDIVRKTPGARIHNVTSSAHYMGRINFEDLMGEKHYQRWLAYGQSKLANVFFTFELQKRLQAAGADTLVNTSHPGFVMGNLQTRSLQQSGKLFESLLYRLMGPVLGQDVHMGVLPMLYAMTSPRAKGGALYGPHTLKMRGYPEEQRAKKSAYDEEARSRFWGISGELTGVKFLF